MSWNPRIGLTVLLCALAAPSLADGAGLAAQHCAGCHALQPKDYRAGLRERSGREAPPLYYAGNKYRAEWLREWLQAPTRLYPAGYYPPRHAQASADGDTVDPQSLPQHPALDAAQAATVADYLMSLRPYDERLAEETYAPGKVPLRMGRLDFRRFKGCNACHRDEPGEGGLSGPELHSAWQRLNPAFMVSFMRNPTLWDPHSMMPVPRMNDAAIHKLADYLHTIAEE